MRKEISLSSGKVSLSFEAEYSLMRLIETEIELQQELARVRVELAKRQDFNVADVY